MVVKRRWMRLQTVPPSSTDDEAHTSPYIMNMLLSLYDPRSGVKIRWKGAEERRHRSQAALNALLSSRQCLQLPLQSC